MTKPIHIIKIGGKIIDNMARRRAFLDAFSRIQAPKILVHGGGKTATDMATQLGVETKMIAGRRVTTPAMMKVVTMVYGGLINKEIVATLQSRGCLAVGICGADGNIIPAYKRPVREIDYGLAGNISGINPALIVSMLRDHFCPVIAPLTHDGKGQLLNTNADTIAAELAISLSGSADIQLCYCFEKNGVLKDPADSKSIIPEITFGQYQTLKAAGVIFEGMIPKLDNAFRVIQSGGQVRIGSADELETLIEGQGGTVLLP